MTTPATGNSLADTREQRGEAFARLLLRRGRDGGRQEFVAGA